MVVDDVVVGMVVLVVVVVDVVVVVEVDVVVCCWNSALPVALASSVCVWARIRFCASVTPAMLPL